MIFNQSILIRKSACPGITIAQFQEYQALLSASLANEYLIACSLVHPFECNPVSTTNRTALLTA
jgi:hypothetical protein